MIVKNFVCVNVKALNKLETFTTSDGLEILYF